MDNTHAPRTTHYAALLWQRYETTLWWGMGLGLVIGLVGLSGRVKLTLRSLTPEPTPSPPSHAHQPKLPMAHHHTHTVSPPAGMV